MVLDSPANPDHKNQRKVMFVFEKRKNTLISKIIRWWTQSDYCHVELFDLYEGVCFGARPTEGVGSGLVEDRFENPVFYRLNYSVPEAQYENLIQTAINYVGYPYNYLGILSFVWNKFFGIDFAFTCAQFVFQILKENGILLLNKKAEKTTAQDIAESIMLVRID